MMNSTSVLKGILLASFLPSANAQLASDVHDAKVVDTIAFGSCYNPRDKKHVIFDAIIGHKPDVFVFLGDNIYGDTRDMAVLKKKYGELEAIEGFRKLRNSTQLVATWDDHDYGANDGGKSYSKREESAEIFLDFFKEPKDSPRRKREGIYTSYTFGASGQTCQIILLDTRYFRDEIPRSKTPRKKGTVGWYEPTDDTSKTLLGEAQWTWLEKQLQVPADVRIIASSIQVLAVEKGMENWGHAPHEQKKLFDLLEKHQVTGAFAISGDVHFAELSKRDVNGYPFYDFTSSGMSHTGRSWSQATNSFRVGKSYPVLNAGLIEIDWKAGAVKLSIIDAAGKKISPQLIKLKDLSFPKK